MGTLKVPCLLHIYTVESMLIISFVTSLNLGVENWRVPIILETMGFVVTVVFLFSIIIQWRQITKMEDDFKNEFTDSKINFHLISNSFIGLILMFMFLMMWGLFLIYLP